MWFRNLWFSTNWLAAKFYNFLWRILWTLFNIKARNWNENINREKIILKCWCLSKNCTRHESSCQLTQQKICKPNFSLKVLGSQKLIALSKTSALSYFHHALKPPFFTKTLSDKLMSEHRQLSRNYYYTERSQLRKKINFEMMKK